MIFGHIRFSYPGLSDVLTARSAPNHAALLSALHDPLRLARRFHLFEALCLPSLRWQTDQDFRALILTSPTLPPPWRARLEAAVATVPQAEILTSDATDVTAAINPWLAAQPEVRRGRTIHFRLDDDDALAADHIATLRARAPGLPDHSLISRPSGVMLCEGEDGPQLLAEFAPYLALGLAIVNPAGHVANPFQMSHLRRYRAVPSLLLPGPLAYIHSAHAASDTRSVQPETQAAARAEHSRHFAARPRRFRQAVEAQFGGLGPAHWCEVLRSMPQT